MAILSNQTMGGVGPGSSGPAIQNSLRLRKDAQGHGVYTPGSTGNRQKYTVYAIVKRCAPGTSNYIFFQGSTTGVLFETDDELDWYFESGAGGEIHWNGKFRDPAAWYEVCVAVDTTQATNTNRVKAWVNGNQLTVASAAWPAQNYNSQINLSGNAHYLGMPAVGSPYEFNGYCARFILVDGQALTPDTFSAANANGERKPLSKSSVITNVGAFGTLGRFYDWADTTNTTTLGYDVSGNANHITLNNISLTSGVTYDAMIDSPTNDTASDTRPVGNYCTLNPLWRDPTNPAVLSDGNLKLTGVTQYAMAFGTHGMSSGKFYWECHPDALNIQVGLAKAGIAIATANYLGQDAYGWGYYGSDGSVYTNGGSAAYGNTFTSGDIIGVAFDATNGKLFFSKNNTWQNSGDPVNGTNAAATGLTSGPYFPAVADTNSGSAISCSVNFGQRPFAYTPPTGFQALCTTNLTQSAVDKPYEHMDIETYTGNGSTKSITGLAFAPDLVWIKSRASGWNHGLFDRVRGALQYLASNTTSAESTLANSLTSFNSDGFSLGSEVGFNSNSDTLVAWNWKAGGSGVSNTAGTITSTVSANTTAGFSIVTYTGTGANATVGHGLGVAPKLVIVKSRDRGTGAPNWIVYHSNTDASPQTAYLYLNLTNAKGTGYAGYWNSTSPTSSVVSIGTHPDINTLNEKYVAYCFAEIDGFSKFGSYTGNGSADGPFVWCGFRPRWVLIKRTDSAREWVVIDTARDTYNASKYLLFPNGSFVEESTLGDIDITSNGFKVRYAGGYVNQTSANLIFAAFAEYPFAANANAR